MSRRLPFTVVMETAIVWCALGQGVVGGHLAPETQRRWGFGLHDLWEGRPYTLFTAPFFVRDLRMLLGIVLLVGYSVAVYEWLAGTGQALVVYWVTNTAGLLAAALVFVWPLYRAGFALGKEVALLSDVGPSAGGLGCIGAWIRMLPSRHRRHLFVTVLVYLIAKLVLIPELFADSAHLVAFPLGFFLAGRPLFAAPRTPPRTVLEQPGRRG